MITPSPRPDAWSEIRTELADAGADALLVSDPASVRYLSGFTSPDDGRVLVLPTDAVLITDGRYTAQAQEEAQIRVHIARPWHTPVAELVGDRTLAIEADALTVADFEAVENALGRPPISTRGIVRSARAVKSGEELEILREAARITDVAFARAMDVLRPGVREADVAWEIATVLHEHGATPSFDVVIASGHRSSMPHGVASHKTVAEGDLVTLDLGARIHGYHADMTRTVAVGDPGEEARELHAAVLDAQVRALRDVRAGMRGADLDRIARDVLAAHGLADAFSHSLGHGVGLQIHEAPSLSQRSDDTLAPGMVVSVEPGAYLPGVHGVRIEDLVVVLEEGCEVLSHSSKDLLHLPVEPV